ncbi:MAG TPA: glycosyl transferase, partial [Firmicutes bacterium]|nr:glycosyl transferase [Bacillota bacterium]
MKRVLIGSPVKQDPGILGEFLQSLSDLDTTGLEVAYAFVDDQEGRGADPQLSRFAAERPGVRLLPGAAKEATADSSVTAQEASGPPAYRQDDQTHVWSEDLVRRVAEYKNRLLRLALDGGFDFVFLVDSDLVLHPQTLVHLVSLNLDIVAEVFWTRWFPELPPLPQVWVGDQYRLWPQAPGEVLDEDELRRRAAGFLAMLRRPGTYRVGGLGACTLISRRALLLGVSFSPVPGLDASGEDRHFCARAAALGLDLYADTHYPPYHLYRQSDLEGVEAYRRWACRSGAHGMYRGNRITLMMLVRNEAGRYLARVLDQARRFVDSAVILDDASTDDTVRVCQEVLAGVPLTLVSNPEPGFADEAALRRQLWDLAVATNPDWLLALDADELFEESAPFELPLLAADPLAEAYAFRLYDMWDEGHYREDAFWNAHHRLWTLLVRYLPGFPYRWRETPLHCGRLPCNLNELRVVPSPLRVKHLGWIRPADRLAKY